MNMNTNKAFIVNYENGSTRIITKGVLVEDIKAQLAQIEPNKIRTKDIESYADELMNRLTGQALAEGSYETQITDATVALRDFSTLTPYQYAQLINLQPCNSQESKS